MRQTCKKCGIDKPIEDYNKRGGKYGSLYRYTCRMCDNAYRTSWKERNPQYRVDEARKAKDKRERDRLEVLIRGAKSRAKISGYPFDITRDDIYVPDTCPVLNIPLVWGQDERSDHSPSLDKFYPEKGYVKGNVRVISFLANRLKNDASLKDLRAIVGWMEHVEHKGKYREQGM